MTVNNTNINLAILDDHPIFIRSFDVLCASEQYLTLKGKFNHTNELLIWLKSACCDVLILDYILQNDEMDGLTLIKHLLIHYPHLKILLSTSVDSLAVIRAAYMTGVRGYISKREDYVSYISAIRLIANGQYYIPRNIEEEIKKIVFNKNQERGLNVPSEENLQFEILFSQLTPREVEVVNCYLEGMGVNEIAEKLNRSKKTVSGHKQSAVKKLGISSDLELFKYKDDLFK